MRAEALDFVQINYALDDRSAEQRILPLAAERGVAVLINRPFGGGNLLRRLGGRALPGWAADIGATSWAQVLLKFVLAHPAVSCAIPGTGNPVHGRQRRRRQRHDSRPRFLASPRRLDRRLAAISPSLVREANRRARPARGRRGAGRMARGGYNPQLVQQMPRRMSAHPEIRPGQSVELLKQLHILTRDGKMNQDSRRKLKQVYHLYHFIEPCSPKPLRRIRRSSSSITAQASPTSASSSTTCSSRISLRRGRSSASRPATNWSQTRGGWRTSWNSIAACASTISAWPSRSSRSACPNASTSSPHCMPATPPPTTRSASRSKAGALHRAGALLPGRSRGRHAQEQAASARRRNLGTVAPPDPHARVRQSCDQRPALPAAGKSWLSGQRHRAGGLGALDEERADHRQLQGSARRRPAERLTGLLQTLGLEELAGRFFCGE